MSLFAKDHKLVRLSRVSTAFGSYSCAEVTEANFNAAKTISFHAEYGIVIVVSKEGTELFPIGQVLKMSADQPLV